MRITIKGPSGEVVGSVRLALDHVSKDDRLLLTDPQLKQHLEDVLKHGIPTGPDSGVQAKPSVGILLDYLSRMGYTFETDDSVDKAPGISADGGSESPDPGHVVGDTSPKLKEDDDARL